MGFSNGTPMAHAPWLPVSESHRTLAVDVQEDEPGSLLNFYRQLLRWRKDQPALVGGTMTLLDRHEQVLAYVRECPTQRVLCLFNLSAAPVVWAIPSEISVSQTIVGSGLQGAVLDAANVRLEPWGGLFALLD